MGQSGEDSSKVFGYFLGIGDRDLRPAVAGDDIAGTLMIEAYYRHSPAERLEYDGAGRVAQTGEHEEIGPIILCQCLA